MGGAALHFGNVAEMKTGEGKTLTCAARLPQRAERQGRARRHRQRLPGQTRRRVDGPRAPLPRARRRRDPVADDPERRAAYAADITYGTNNEFGFDYLRDNMAHSPRTWCSAATTSPSSTRSTRSSSTRPAPADHLRPGRRRVELVHRVRPHRPADGEGRPLRGGPAQAHHRRARAASSSSRTSSASTTSTRRPTRRWSAT
jgi:hypothetical protein